MRKMRKSAAVALTAAMAVTSMGEMCIRDRDCADLVIEGFKGEAARPELEAIVIE